MSSRFLPPLHLRSSHERHPPPPPLDGDRPLQGLRPAPRDALDLDGFEEVGLFFRVDNWNSGGSTLTTTIAHAPGNGDVDRLPLVPIPIRSGSRAARGRHLLPRSAWQIDDREPTAFADKGSREGCAPPPGHRPGVVPDRRAGLFAFTATGR